MRIPIAFLGAATALMAQSPAAKTFTSAADVAAMINKARNERKADQANFSQPLLQAAPYTVSLEYRVKAVDGTAAIHETEAEVFYVLEGEATLITGGKLHNGKRSNPTNLSATSIDGGDSRRIKKGDFFLVPENTPHQFTDAADALVLMSLHIPRGGP